MRLAAAMNPRLWVSKYVKFWVGPGKNGPSHEEPFRAFAVFPRRFNARKGVSAPSPVCCCRNRTQRLSGKHCAEVADAFRFPVGGFAAAAARRFGGVQSHSLTHTGRQTAADTNGGKTCSGNDRRSKFCAVWGPCGGGGAGGFPWGQVFVPGAACGCEAAHSGTWAVGRKRMGVEPVPGDAGDGVGPAAAAGEGRPEGRVGGACGGENAGGGPAGESAGAGAEGGGAEDGVWGVCGGGADASVVQVGSVAAVGGGAAQQAAPRDHPTRAAIVVDTTFKASGHSSRRHPVDRHGVVNFAWRGRGGHFQARRRLSGGLAGRALVFGFVCVYRVLSEWGVSSSASVVGILAFYTSVYPVSVAKSVSTFHVPLSDSVCVYV